MSHNTIAAISGIITSQDSNLIVITAFGTTNGNNSLEREFLELVWTGNVRAIREHLVRLQKQNQVSAVIDCKDDEGRYAIMKAAFQGFSEVVQLLIDFGASLTTKSKMGESILMFAVASGSLETVQVLLEHGADVHHMNKSGWTSLMIASYRGHYEIAKELIAHVAFLHDVQKFGWNSLMLAAASGRTDVIKYLIDQGGNMNLTNKNGENALTIAIRRGHIPAVQTLVDCGLDLKYVKKELKSLQIKVPSERVKLDIEDYLRQLDADIKKDSKPAKPNKSSTSASQTAASSSTSAAAAANDSSSGSEWLLCELSASSGGDKGKDRFFHHIPSKSSSWEKPEGWRKLVSQGQVVSVPDDRNDISIPTATSPFRISKLYERVLIQQDEVGLRDLTNEAIVKANFHAQAFLMLLKCQEITGPRLVPKDLDATIATYNDLSSWMWKKIVQEDDAYLQYIVAMCYIHHVAQPTYEDRAGLLLMLSAEQAYAPAVYFHGKYLLEHNDVDELTDAVKHVFYTGGVNYIIFELFQMSANGGFALAQVELADLFGENDEDIQQKQYLELAANQGYALGKYALARFHQDKAELALQIDYTRQAAVAGVSDAQYDLGSFYEKGIKLTKPDDEVEELVPIDLKAAEEWYSLCSNNATVSKQNASEKARERLLVMELEKTSPDCPICMEKMNPRGGKFLFIPGCCGATFHFECIKKATSTKKRCPICRKIVGQIQ